MISTLTRQVLSFLFALLVLISGLPMAVFADDNPEAPADISEASETEEAGTFELIPSESEEADAPEPIPSESEEADASETNPSLPEETVPAVTLCPQPEAPALTAAEILTSSGPGLYFGLLHGHSDLSIGDTDIDSLFRTAAETERLDFFAVADHSDSFDNHESGAIGTDGSIVSSDWAAGKAAATNVTSQTFLGIFGYEMNWPARLKIGHISSFGTPGFQSWTQPPYCDYEGALEAYYDTLATAPGISLFNHPGTQYGSFHDLDYDPDADRHIHLMELDFSVEEPCRYYMEALDRGWHLAPTAGQSLSAPVRTAVYAQSLTEAGVLEALSSRRAYATEDADLEITCSLDGYPMGSIAQLRHLKDTPELSVSLRDPSDSAVGLVEVISTGGSIDQQALDAPEGTLSFSLPRAEGYYFLKITQPDGDLAVTAPVWIDGREDLGISALTCETEIPVQNGELILSLDLYNQESAPLLVESLEVLVNGIPAYTDPTLTRIPALTAMTHRIRMALNCLGTTELTVRIRGTLDGCSRNYEAGLSLGFHRSEQVTAILVDNGHGNVGMDQLKNLKALALKENIALQADTVTADTLKTCRFLLVTAPTRPFSRDFLDAAAEFAGYGGSLVICGQADALDGDSSELNRLLEAVGSGIRLGDDSVRDPVNNSGDPATLNIDELDMEGVPEGQVFLFRNGCTVIPGSGTSLITGRDTTCSIDGDGDGLGGTTAGKPVLMASEPLSGGGILIAAGCLFSDDEGLRDPDNLKDPGYANRSITAKLLGIGGDPIPLRSIQEAREGGESQLFRIRGYVTAGTSNPYTTFPDTIYLQDDTGGIAVTPFRADGIQAGTALEISGYVRTESGNRVLDPIDWEILELAMLFPQPEFGTWTTLLDPGKNGGSLVEITGRCLEVYGREDHTLSGFLLEDDSGHQARIQIEDYIFAGSDGKNELHKSVRKGREIRVTGLLHVNEYGDPVIRLRNCEEAVWVPPKTYINPRTGDLGLPVCGSSMALALAGLLRLRKKK